MEELIEILINVISRFFENKAIKPTTSSTNRAVVAVRPDPPSRATVTKKMPTARRAVRRPAPPAIAIAQPIITRVADAPVTMAVSRPIQAKQSAVAAPAPATQSAAAIRKWLSPTTLRNQFLLTEILQPPLALRDNK